VGLEEMQRKGVNARAAAGGWTEETVEGKGRLRSRETHHSASEVSRGTILSSGEGKLREKVFTEAIRKRRRVLGGISSRRQSDD